jgi:hypothetical protein
LVLEVDTMTREQAIREGRKRWGKRAIVRAGEALSSPEQRAEAMDRLKRNRARRDEIDREVQARLNTLDWYRAAQAERKACLQEVSQTQGWASYYKFSVGLDIGIAFSVEGQGDTWEEAFAKADPKRVPA